VRPAINALLGVDHPLPRLARGRLSAPVRRNPARHEFVRALASFERDDVVVEPLAGQESHMIVRAGRANALLSVEPGEGELAAGSPARFLPLG
jgi:molybdopterin biosynthesis enzyme